MTPMDTPEAAPNPQQSNNSNNSTVTKDATDPAYSANDSQVDAYPRQCFLAAAYHDVHTLRGLLDAPPDSMTSVEAANMVDPGRGWTLLHAAVVTQFENASQRGQQAADVEETGKPSQQAEDTLHLLLQNGAIWNALDLKNKTPGCLAQGEGCRRLYDILVEAGVRAELLFGKLDEYEMLAEEDVDEGEGEEDQAALVDGEEGKTPEIEVTPVEKAGEAAQPAEQGADAEDDLTNEKYLSKSLKFQANRILDSENNAVMMEWERHIMRRTVESLLPTNCTERGQPVRNILNIGHGLGIISSLFLSHARAVKQPVSLHIIEPHPDVLDKLRASPDSWLDAELIKTVRSFREYNEPEAPLPKADGVYDSDENSKNLEVVLHPNTWQDALPRLLTDNVTFDAIFFDTFAEDYKAFKEFFSEYVIGLLEQEGRWSFFHGLGADRQICYDVYTKVLECDLMEAGFDVEWESLDSQEGTQEWEGVRRKYWTLDKYRLPICTFLE